MVITQKILPELGEDVFTEFGGKKSRREKKTQFITTSITKFSDEKVTRKTSHNSAQHNSSQFPSDP